MHTQTYIYINTNIHTYTYINIHIICLSLKYIILYVICYMLYIYSERYLRPLFMTLIT